MSSGSDGYGTRLWKFWFPDAPALLWLVAAIMPILFFQTLMHEGTHALTYVSSNRGVEYLAPFPHEHVYSDGSRAVLNGAAGSESASRDTADVAAPQFLAIALLLALSLFLWLVPYLWPMRNRTVRLWFRAWYLALCFDILWNTGGKLIFRDSPNNDWNRYQAVQGYSDGTMFGLSFLILLIPLTYLAWGYFSRWHDDPPESPRFTGNFGHGFWDYRWAAFIFGILSLMAILFSLIVSDPSINKDHGAFVAPLVFQFLMAVLFWVYFALSFHYRENT